MPTKTMIHKGTQEIVIPAKRELVEVPDPESGEGAVKLEEQEVEPERTQKVKLPAGTRFGEYLIKTPYEISDPEVQKSLKNRGFEFVNREQAKKLDARAEREESKTLPSINDKAAEEDRDRAAKNQAIFEPSTAGEDVPTPKEGRK